MSSTERYKRFESYGAVLVSEKASDGRTTQSRMDSCSACRGDYENPDVSAMNEGLPVPEDEEESDDEADEEFPARRERR